MPKNTRGKCFKWWPWCVWWAVRIICLLERCVNQKTLPPRENGILWSCVCAVRYVAFSHMRLFTFKCEIQLLCMVTWIPWGERLHLTYFIFYVLLPLLWNLAQISHLMLFLILKTHICARIPATSLRWLAKGNGATRSSQLRRMESGPIKWGGAVSDS